MTRAVVRTSHPAAARVAAALAPDNTPELTTDVADGQVVTAITRETTGGLRATLDDYLVNLGVAHEVASITDRNANRETFNDDPTTDTNE